MRSHPLRRALVASLLVILHPLSASAGGKVIEQAKTYTVTGTTGIELYRSIGERGPKLGSSRTIAHTGFRLTWQRDYQRRGNACVLASAVPTLVITTTLPKASGKLSPAVRESWERFVEGVTAHEAVHAGHIKDLVADIEKSTIGLTESNDPDCRKIRERMQPILGALSKAERQKQRDFDEVEFANGGAVHQLILTLANGP